LLLAEESAASEAGSEEKLSKQHLESKPSTLSSSSKEQLVGFLFYSSVWLPVGPRVFCRTQHLDPSH